MGNLNFGDYDDETAAQEKEEIDASGGAEFMKLKVGRNLIRVLPPPAGQRKPFRVVYQHFIEIGPVKKSVICARLEAKKPCEVCKKVEELRKSKDPDMQEMANSWFARRRVFVNVINRQDPTKGPMVLAFGKSVHEQMVALRSDEEAGANYTHPLTGHDLVIERVGTGKNDTKYKVMLGKQKPLGATENVMQEWIDTQQDLNSYAKLPSLQEMRQLLSGEASDEDEEVAAPKATSKKKRTAEDDTIDVEAEDA